jgi:protein involved in polysaccharide export with SLBB domain
MTPLTKGLALHTFWLRLLSIVFISLLCCSTAFAQLPTEQDDLQIDPNALKNASPSELINFLQDFNQQKQKAGEDVHKSKNDLPDASQEKTDVVIKDSTQRDNIKNSFLSPQSVYGSNIFQNSQIMQLSELSTPPPDYPVGVGDHIIVSLWGGADFEQDYIVGRDGSIFPQGLGKITVQGLSFANAKSIIFERFKKVIPKSTNISVSLGQPRSIVVQVSGNVGNPGPKVVSAFTNALNIVAMAGGVTKYGNLRKILISRRGAIIDSIDVYKYLSTGDFGKHLYLENNDFIIVPFYDKKVLASGQFKRPMYYQLKRGEGLDALLGFAGGFTSDAYATGGMIIRNVNEKQTIKTINLNNAVRGDGSGLHEEPLYDGDIILVNAIHPGLTNKVIVKGEVAYPNVYEVKKGDRLFDVINRAGGVTPNSYLDRAYIYKGAGDSTNVKADKIDVSLSDINKNDRSKYNIPVDPNDVIEVFNKNQFSDRQLISIDGEVRKPGNYEKYGGMTLKDLLYFANGLKPTAEFGSIEVSSIVDIDSSQKGLVPTRTVVKTYSIDQDLDLDSVTENIVLKPYDQVFVRKNPRFQLQQNIKVEGQVKYPGIYPKLSENERLSSLMARTGGLKENSNAKGAILYRKRMQGQATDSLASSSEPISIDLQNAIDNPGSKFDLILQEGDVVFIPETNPVVAVKGAVQNQLKIYYDKDHPNVGYYVNQAGGFSERPWRKRIYVTRANGKSEKTRNLGFFHLYPKVKPGSVITVPVRPEGKGLSSSITQGFISAIPIALVYLITKL